MGRAKKITITQWIQNYGVKRLATELEVHRNTVKRWVTNGDLPADKYKKTIITLSQGRLTFNDFFV